jgi:hypothetical protein
MRVILYAAILLPLCSWAEPSITTDWQYQAPVVGSPITVRFMGRDLPEIYGMEMTLSFSGVQPVLEKPVKAGAFWGDQKSVELNNAADRDGNVDWVFSLLRPAEPVAGKGELARITFMPTEAALISLGMAEIKFGTTSGEVIEPVIQLSEKPLRIYSTMDQVPREQGAWFWIAVAAGATLAALMVAILVLRRRQSSQGLSK